MKNESVKKSLEKSKNVLEEKRKTVKRKICIKKAHVYNNSYELRSRAIKHKNKLKAQVLLKQICLKQLTKYRKINTIKPIER